ncbi:uncharacterized protein LOC112451087 [Kryptolebias marmoratus]|uniref:uncharacterized protein LOC112451087 n=1 Tax=Kryptolebias marmoratus TaxID=37003 RepID=UPI000D52F63E|nr:uncharacterized protein LOC112451087 [Kryptolebias marmoratus]
MMKTIKLIRVLLLAALLPTGVRGDKVSVFVYSPLGGDALLPCTTVASPGCSSITWTFFKVGHVHLIEEVSEGHIRDDSDKFNRTSITSNCSLIVRGLIVEDVGSYACLENQKPVMDVYLSLLSIHSTSSVTDLQPGGTLVLTCVLFTFYNAGSCKSYSSVFRLHWLQENGTQLPKDSRYQLTENTRCNVTLLTKLRPEDDGRRWRCQVTTGDNMAAFVDFRSSFLFHMPSSEPSVSGQKDGCHAELPVSRILLCVALPLMVGIVGFFTWKSERRTERRTAAGIELQQDVHCPPVCP